MTESELFKAIGRELYPDPSRTLKPVTLPTYKPDIGPYHKVQYVIELVGQQTIPANHAKSLLETKVKSGLGNPEIYVTIPGQSRWMALWTGDDSIGYDSLAFAWDLVSEKGNLSTENASELWKRCEQIANPLNRRAIPMPPSDQVDFAVSNLLQIKSSFDIGIDLIIDAPHQVPINTAIAVETAYAIGYRLTSSGFLEWKQLGWPESLLTILPIEGDDLPIGGGLSGLAIGFSFAISPNPKGVLERLFESANAIANATQSKVIDADGRLLSNDIENEMRRNLESAIDSYESAGFTPGTPESLRLFE